MKKLLVSVIALLATVSLSAQDLTAVYNEAAAAFGNKDFAGAAAKFEEVIDKGMDDETAWELSLCCLENARDILLALETEFRSLYARNLTLSRLGEAVILPLCPDKGGCITYDVSRAASACLEGDIEMLKRMRPAD
mgnify:CR=1 FL=1